MNPWITRTVATLYMRSLLLRWRNPLDADSILRMLQQAEETADNLQGDPDD